MKRLAGFWALLFCAAIFAAGGIGLSDKLISYMTAKYGSDAKQRLLDWEKVIDKGKTASERNKLDLANDFFNQIPYVSDLQHWGVKDYWATPVEMLASDGGDCEDYAIGKYFTLIAMGVSEDKLKITYVRELRFDPVDQAHMVLAYYPTPDADPLILDNVDKAIWPGSERDDLVPVYSFNGAGLWLAKERGAGMEVGKPDRISMWNDLIARMNREANR
ncbi:MAG: sulfate adenylyltransferase [Burkholderiales bacterium]|nr:sulfate adenylyltransferase [Burkholderiales bacterium]